MDVETVGDRRALLKDLAPYVYRVALSNNRIGSMDDTHVVFRYTPSGTSRRLTAITDPTGDIVYRAPLRVPVLDSS